MKVVLFALIGLCFTIAISCDPKDRCDGGFYWDDDAMTCFSVPECDKCDTSPPDCGDTGQDGGGDTPGGLGDSCTLEGGECAGKEANHCSWDYMEETGYCTVAECSEAPDNCPTGYRCCDVKASWGGPDKYCVTDEDYKTLDDMNFCSGG